MTETIEYEVVPEEELLLIDAALQNATSIMQQSSFPTHSETSAHCPDIEDLGSLSGAENGCRASQAPREEEMSPWDLIRSWGRCSVFATQVCSQEWCEKQLDFTLRLKRGEEEETASMMAGREHHLEVELEVHALVDVEVATREDVIGLKILNLRTSAYQLCGGSSCAREIPVFGMLGSLWITGIIDELKVSSDGKLTLAELKTRGRPSLPSEAQKRCTHLQLMMYKHLWDKLVTEGIDAGKISTFHRVDLDARFSNSFQKVVRESGSRSHTLRELIADTSDLLAFCPQADPNFVVTYRHLGPPVVELGQVQLRFDQRLFLSIVSDKERYWLGKREPEPVRSSEAWKCKFCPFSQMCPSSPHYHSLPKQAEAMELYELDDQRLSIRGIHEESFDEARLRKILAEWNGSGKILLPVTLSRQLRRKLHQICDDMGFNHDTAETSQGRQLSITKPSCEAGAACHVIGSKRNDEGTTAMVVPPARGQGDEARSPEKLRRIDVEEAQEAGAANDEAGARERLIVDEISAMSVREESSATGRTSQEPVLRAHKGSMKAVPPARREALDQFSSSSTFQNPSGPGNAVKK